MYRYGRRLRIAIRAVASWLLTPFRWTGELLTKVEINNLMDRNRLLRSDIERLEHELVLEKQRADAAENNVEVLLLAHETNLKLLDRMVHTHGVNSAAH